MDDKHIGSTLESLLKKEGIYEEATASAVEHLRNALIAGEQSGESTPFDFDAFIAAKQANFEKLIDEGLDSGISSRSKDDIHELGLQKLADAARDDQDR